MRERAKRAKKLSGTSFAECCGQVCDGRCREASLRFRGFERRLSVPGATRMS